jgi:hypothetical protein
VPDVLTHNGRRKWHNNRCKKFIAASDSLRETSATKTGVSRRDIVSGYATKTGVTSEHARIYFTASMKEIIEVIEMQRQSKTDMKGRPKSRRKRRRRPGPRRERRRHPVERMSELALKPGLTQNSEEKMRRIENLKPWKPGQSGNPGGRPKRRPITERYAKVAEVPVEEKIRKALKLPEGSTLADAAVKSAYQGAIEGDLDALKEIREGIEGRNSDPLVSVSLSLSEAVALTENKGEVPTWLQGEMIETFPDDDGSN